MRAKPRRSPQSCMGGCNAGSGSPPLLATARVLICINTSGRTHGSMLEEKPGADLMPHIPSGILPLSTFTTADRECVGPEQWSILYRLNPAHRRKILVILCRGSAAVEQQRPRHPSSFNPPLLLPVPGPQQHPPFQVNSWCGQSLFRPPGQTGLPWQRSVMACSG